MICAVIKRNHSIKECASIRLAKEYAIQNGADLILVFRTEISSTLHNLHLTAVYCRLLERRIFTYYTPEEYQRLLDLHLI